MIRARVIKGFVKDKDSVIVKGGARPYRFEITIGKTLFFTSWLSGTDATITKKKKQLLAGLAKIKEFETHSMEEMVSRPIDTSSDGQPIEVNPGDSKKRTRKSSHGGGKKPTIEGQGDLF